MPVPATVPPMVGASVVGSSVTGRNKPPRDPSVGTLVGLLDTEPRPDPVTDGALEGASDVGAAVTEPIPDPVRVGALDGASDVGADDTEPIAEPIRVPVSVGASDGISVGASDGTAVVGLSVVGLRLGFPGNTVGCNEVGCGVGLYLVKKTEFSK